MYLVHRKRHSGSPYGIFIRRSMNRTCKFYKIERKNKNNFSFNKLVITFKGKNKKVKKIKECFKREAKDTKSDVQTRKQNDYTKTKQKKKQTKNSEQNITENQRLSNINPVKNWR